MPTEELFGNYHFLLEQPKAADGIGDFVFEPNDEPLWVALEGAGGVIEFTMFAGDGTPLRAWPVKWTGPTLNAKGGTDVAMEELVLDHEGFEAAVRAYFENGGQKLYVSRSAEGEEDMFLFRTEETGTAEASRFDPYKSFKFKVDWDGTSTEAEVLVPGVYVEEISAFPPSGKDAGDQGDDAHWALEPDKAAQIWVPEVGDEVLV